MAELKRYDFDVYTLRENEGCCADISESQTGKYCEYSDVEQYARQKVLEELETQLMKYRKEYYDGRCFADDIEQRIKQLKEVKQP
jgi:hypothetical protein